MGWRRRLGLVIVVLFFAALAVLGLVLYGTLAFLLMQGVVGVAIGLDPIAIGRSLISWVLSIGMLLLAAWWGAMLRQTLRGPLEWTKGLAFLAVPFGLFFWAALERGRKGGWTPETTVAAFLAAAAAYTYTFSGGWPETGLRAVVRTHAKKLVIGSVVVAAVAAPALLLASKHQAREREQLLARVRADRAVCEEYARRHAVAIPPTDSHVWEWLRQHDKDKSAELEARYARTLASKLCMAERGHRWSDD